MANTLKRPQPIKVQKYPTLDWLDRFSYEGDDDDGFLEVPVKVLNILQIKEKLSDNSIRYGDHIDVTIGKDLDVFIAAYLHYFRFKVNEMHIELFWKECVENCEEDDEFMDDDYDEYYL